MSELGSGLGSSYPSSLDTDTSQEVNSPNAGKTKARAEVANDHAAAIIAIQTELGTDPAGTATDVKTFNQNHHNTDGTHKAAIIYDGAAYRSASATPAANTVPVSDANSVIQFAAVKTTDGTNIIKTKIVDIGDWNMDTTDTVTIAHGLTLSKIRTVAVQVRNDADSQHKMFNPEEDSSANGWIDDCNTTNVVLYRKFGGVFDNVNHDSTSYNRGWITITYVE